MTTVVVFDVDGTANGVVNQLHSFGYSIEGADELHHVEGPFITEEVDRVVRVGEYNEDKNAVKEAFDA